MYRRASHHGNHLRIGIAAIALIVLTITAVSLTGCSDNLVDSEHALGGEENPGAAGPKNSVLESSGPPGAPGAQTALPDSGAAEMRALAAAYPLSVDELRLVDGEWALRIEDEWFYWADGRLLPEELCDQAGAYVQIRFYRYKLGPPEKWRPIDSELEDRLRERTREITRSSDDGLRDNSFLDTLYGISSRADAEALMESVEFLGRWIRVHPFIVNPLSRVEERIRAAMEVDADTRDYVSGIGSIDAFSWRSIAGTMRRSYHSYGVAVDISPGSYDEGWVYWLWAAESGIVEWWRLPPGQRFRVPGPVIEAFESEGFVWGGKWLFFDQLHFEYRPESIILARSTAE